MKTILSLLLAVYSFFMIGYAVSNLFPASAACTTCFKGETAFAGGQGTTGPDHRAVNVKYSTTGDLGFTGANATRIEQSLNTAITSWNTATGPNNQASPYNFQLNQNIPVSNLQIQLVDKLDNATACMATSVQYNADGSIKSGVIQVKRSALENRTSDEIAKLLEHEIGHFIGLADNYDAEHCDTIMSQAKDGCKPKASGIQQGDVSTVNKYVANSGDCSKKRGKKQNIDNGGGGGYIDPNPIPDYYPRTCYYYYDSVDIYQYCDCRGGYRYVGTVYYLTDVFCY